MTKPIICPMCGAGLKTGSQKECWDELQRYYALRYYQVVCIECTWRGNISTEGDDNKK